MIMRSTVWNRLLQASVVLVLGATVVSVAAAGPAPNRPRRPRAVSLFAGANLVFEVNRIQCFLVSSGEVCSAGGSPIGGGGFWPKGTPDQYIFNSGLQLAGVIPSNAGFAWAGDTIGAYFFDARGDQAAGEALTGLYNSLNPADAANWPTAGKALDPAIYNAVLLNRNTVSQGDAWVRYWEGNPAFLTGREHPMGIVVDQRTMGWNFPVGNEDIIYHVFTFYNVSASAASGKYNNSTIQPAVRAEIAAQGDAYRAAQLNRFNVQIPDTGYAIRDMYAAFAMDADVAVFNQDYSTAFLPFNIGSIYSGTFLPEVGWRFPEDIFGAPFYPAPGFIGVKYLLSPKDTAGNEVGLTMFSATLNSGTGFPDPVGVRQLYRYLSGFVGPTDNPCSPFTNPVIARARRLCFLGQTQADARFYQGSGPFVLPAGESRTIVVAYIQAAPTNDVQPLIGTDVKPGIPFTGDSIFQDRNKIRQIDRIAGWVSEDDTNGNSRIDEYEVQTVPRSLLNKAEVAQAVFNSKFLLPFAPEAPEFYLVPGDNQVTVVWKASQSEADGDPFFAVASDPGSALYDPNFRQYDVEGYRIYRGRSASELELVGQFDYTGTSYLDFTGALAYGDENGNGLLECAPELGVTADCPTFPFEQGLAGDLVQVPAGGRVLLANGSVLITRADTAVTGGGAVCGTAPCPTLENTGIPFAFVDAGVRNSFTYFYTVTAFDVNSLKSGPTSLESPRVTKRVTPRKSVTNQSVASLSYGIFGDSAIALDPSQPANWTIDATGKFPGPPPPTGGLAAVFAPLVPQLLGPLNLAATIDSVLPRSNRAGTCPGLGNTQGVCYEFFVSYISGSDTDRTRTTLFWPIWTGFGEAASVSPTLAGSAVPADSEAAARFGIPNGRTSFNAAMQIDLREYIDFSAHEGQQSRRFRPASGSIGNSPGGSRWFDGANETVSHPAYGMRAGHITGVDSIFAPLSHIDIRPDTAGAQAYAPFNPDSVGGNSVRTLMQCHAYVVAALGRQSDIRVTWGGGGTIASVRDITHHVSVPFHSIPQAGYGFITDQNGNGVIDWRDFDDMSGVRTAEAGMGFCASAPPVAPGNGRLVSQPVFGKVAVSGSSPTTNLTGWRATGQGFGIYINGQQFIFQMTPDTTAAPAPPAAGTVWTLRSYAGRVDASSGAGTTTPGGYSFTPVTPSPAIPGIRVVFTVPDRTHATAETANILDNVHTVPDPYYVANSLEFTAGNKVLKFVNLPSQALIRIYSVSGVLVNVIAHNDPGLGAEETWNLRNRNNQLVASGVYFYHVETPEGHTKVGRFTVVTFAP